MKTAHACDMNHRRFTIGNRPIENGITTCGVLLTAGRLERLRDENMIRPDRTQNRGEQRIEWEQKFATQTIMTTYGGDKEWSLFESPENLVFERV